MKRAEYWLCLVLALMSYAKAFASDDSVSKIFQRLEAKDCSGAVRELNVGLTKNSSKVALLAGGLYEEGICVKQDWSRAVYFYLMAKDAGELAAGYRLESGYAAPVGGPDMAAALWWAHQNNRKLLPECTISDSAKNDPDRFVEELRTWTTQRLEACNYVVGVLATIAGDTEYPVAALRPEIEGTVHAHFVPSIPKVEIKGHSSGGYLEKEVRKVADRALQRYPKPAGIDSSWETDLALHFKLD